MNSLLLNFIISLLVFFGSLTYLDEGVLISSGVGVFTFISLKLILDMGNRLPIKELMLFIVFVQLFISPLITYEYFNNESIFIMYVPKIVYMGYMLPAIFAFGIGLMIGPFDKSSGEELSSVRFNIGFQELAIKFIIIGLLFTFSENFYPASVKFIVLLLMQLRFIGVFILLLSNYKFKWIWIIIVYGHFTISTVQRTVFIDLFVWAGFLYMFYEFLNKSSTAKKVMTFMATILIMFFIQSIKKDYRLMTSNIQHQEDVAREELFIDVALNKIEDDNSTKEGKDLDRFISRVNTGWIVSKVLEHTPRYEPFTNGELLKNDLINVLLPRVLFPDKDKTGGKQNSEKFKRFTGRTLAESTIMRIGSFSDAYVNFGVVGGWICMFFFGLVFNILLYYFFSLGKKSPVFYVFIPYIFAYAIRMGDFQVVLNYTFKSLLLFFFIKFMFIDKLRFEGKFKTNKLKPIK